MIAVPTLTSLVGALLVVVHYKTPVIAHNVGEYLGGVAIVFASDTLSALMLFVTGFITAISSGYLISTKEDRFRFVPALVLMLTAGVNGALLTGDLFNLFVFVEVMLLPSYALIAVTGSWRRLGVGRLFVIVNLVTSTILVLAVGFVYGVTGTVNLAKLVEAAKDNPQLSLAAAVVLFALLVKSGVVPVHGWLPRSYPATSAGVMALFSGIHTKVGLYAVYRIYSTIYGGNVSWLNIFVVLVIATVVIGAISTFGERRLRGALAFQMVSGVGQILIGLIIFTELSLAAGLLYLVHHVITMGALIMASGAIETTYGNGRLDRLHGLMKREPVVAGVTAFGFLSLVGLPPTSGLWGKLGLLRATAESNPFYSPWLIGAVVVASIISLMALQRIWVKVFWGPPMKYFFPDDPLTSRGEQTELTSETRVTRKQLWPATLLISLSVALFVGFGFIWPVFVQAAHCLIDPAEYVKAVLG